MYKGHSNGGSCQGHTIFPSFQYVVLSHLVDLLACPPPGRRKVIAIGLLSEAGVAVQSRIAFTLGLTSRKAEFIFRAHNNTS